MAVAMLMLALGVAAASDAPVMIHSPLVAPDGWEQSGEDVTRDGRMEVLVGLRRSNVEQLDKVFWEASTPGSPRYLDHLTWEAMGQLVRPSEQALVTVTGWLASHGATGTRVAAHGDYIGASLTLPELETMTSGTFVTFVHSSSGRRLVRLIGGVLLPAALAKHVETFTGLHEFPLDASPVVRNQTAATGVTPAVISKQYSIGTVTKSGKTNVQSIAQFQGDVTHYVSPTDLSEFCKQYKSDGGECTIAKFVGKNDPSNPGGESMLDTEYIMGVGQDITTWVYSYPSVTFCSDLLRWASDVANETDHPYVVSISYGSQKIDFCDNKTAARLSQDVLKLGAMGITVVIASGDDGSGQYTRQGTNTGRLSPSFPASIPYALSVGATYFQSGIPSPGPEEATKRFGSGGGFSYDFDVQSYQSSAVQGYLAKNPKTGTASYAQKGRGSPDVAALGDMFETIVGGQLQKTGGTSASTPTWGAIIALLNEECLSASGGSKKLGFVNPLLYGNPNAFTDITVGSNAIGDNEASGWKCTEGWDAVTGLGTPVFDKLQAVVKKACGGGVRKAQDIVV